MGEGERVASSNELAAFYRVNPATAGARERLVRARRRRFADRYVRPLVVEAARLGIGLDELLGLVREERASAEVTTGADA